VSFIDSECRHRSETRSRIELRRRRVVFVVCSIVRSTFKSCSHIRSIPPLFYRSRERSGANLNCFIGDDENDE